MTADLRRADDKRFDALNQKIDDMDAKLDALTLMLIGEPERSDLGRTLLKLANANAESIDAVRNRYEPMYDWWQQTKGVWRGIIGLAVVLGLIATFFSLLSYFGQHIK